MSREAQMLGTEVGTKEVAVFPQGLWSHLLEDRVHLFGMEGKSFSLEVMRNGANEFWGWLNPADMGPEGDRWSLYFAYGVHTLNQQGGEVVWDEALMPRAWAGEVYQHLICGDHLRSILEGTVRGGLDDTDVLVGRFEKEGHEGFWASALTAAPVPDWPKLLRGEDGHKLALEMKMLGVLCRPGKVGLPRQWTAPLLIAWADGQGKFLGWEEIKSMVEVHEMDPTSKRFFEPMDEWNHFEGKLRTDSFAREL